MNATRLEALRGEEEELLWRGGISTGGDDDALEGEGERASSAMAFGFGAAGWSLGLWGERDLRDEQYRVSAFHNAELSRDVRRVVQLVAR